MTASLNPALVAMTLLIAFSSKRDSLLDMFRPSRPTAPPKPPARPPGGSVTLPPPEGVIPASHPGGGGPPPAPWPQVVPAGLPPFPGDGWVPDVPVGTGVAARASQLLPQLWASGAGTFKIENTAGRWIAYRAVAMGAKRGVVAYRERAPVARPVPAAAPGTPTVPQATEPPSVVVTPPRPTPIKGLPTLRLGSKGTDVTIAQRMLSSRGYPTADDGVFGAGTKSAVVAFQRNQGLTADGVVGPQTWGALAVNTREVSS